MKTKYNVKDIILYGCTAISVLSACFVMPYLSLFVSSREGDVVSARIWSMLLCPVNIVGLWLLAGCLIGWLATPKELRFEEVKQVKNSPKKEKVYKTRINCKGDARYIEYSNPISKRVRKRKRRYKKTTSS